MTGAVKSMIPSSIPLICTLVSVAFFVSALIYFIALKKCDGWFWALFSIGVTISFFTGIIAYYNHRKTEQSLDNALKGCVLDPLATRLKGQPLMKPWVGLLLTLGGWGLFLAAIIYYLVTNRCDSWFFAMLVFGFSLDFASGIYHYANNHFRLTIKKTEVDQCKKKLPTVHSYRTVATSSTMY